MSKQIIIIGGGISGLSVLHNLKKKYVGRGDIQINLLEKNTFVGGTARTKYHHKCYFEYGPNGFLDSQESTTNLAKDVGLEEEMVKATPQAKKRFIAVDKTLHALPSNPLELFGFKLLSLKDKLRIPMELFVRRGKNPEESVGEFGIRRLGENFVRYFLDPMVLGIFAGDVNKISIRFAFPKIYLLEQKYGSLLKGLISLLKAKKKKGEQPNVSGQPGGTLITFKKGMGQLCEKIRSQYDDSIHTGEKVKNVDRVGEGFSVETDKLKYFADELYVCSPAYETSEILKDLDPVLAELLGKIRYVSVAVVGLVYARKQIQNTPKGFGYLVPSSENKEVLGVLFPNNIYPNRTDDENFMFRIMIGGDKNPGIAELPKEDVINIAKKELEEMFSITATPVEEFFICWPQAIPQYDKEYQYLHEGIVYELQKFKNFHLVANYLGGISVNDCTRNAFQAVENSVLA